MASPALPPKSGIMICGHGSRNKNAVSQFALLAEHLRARFPDVPVDFGYLEFANPVIHQGLDALVAKGAETIYAVPGMLFAAGHAKNDIPSVLNAYQAMKGNVAVHYGRELGVDLKMLRAASERVTEALIADGWTPGEALHDTLLVVVGRGSSDPDANSNVSKIARMLWEGMGFGWAETAYSGVTFPLVEPALRQVARLDFKRVVVFPYFLFTGVLVNRIYEAVDQVAEDNPGIRFVKASYLNDHPLVIDTFVDRVMETVEGRAVMNCQMCKYREQVLGFEAEVGSAQASHHHHVEGVGGAPENCPCNGDCDGSCRDQAFCEKHGLEWTPVHSHHHDHGHSHDHGHDHHHEHGHAHTHTHAPYPHADHPMGPKTLGRPARARKL